MDEIAAIKNMTYKMFRTIVRSKRMLDGITQDELGFNIDGTQSMIGRIESGNENPTYATRVKILEALNINIGGTDDQYIDSIVSCLEGGISVLEKYHSLRNFINNVSNSTAEDINALNEPLKQIISKRRKENRKIKY